MKMLNILVLTSHKSCEKQLLSKTEGWVPNELAQLVGDVKSYRT